MKTHMGRLCFCTLIWLLSVVGFTTQARAASPYQVLYTFCSEPSCADGYYPTAGLIQDSSGNLYGATEFGGINYGGVNGFGTVFEVDGAGNYTVLYSFCYVGEACTDGAYPGASLIQDSAGNLYGTTSGGGANRYGGTVFKVDSAGGETVLYSFCSASGCTDGWDPVAPLIQDASGNLYGTTIGGGANNGGTAFELDSEGQETVLYSFCSFKNCRDGSGPSAGLIQDVAGSFYGTTGGGGAKKGSGTVFKIDSTRRETVLYTFCPEGDACADGLGSFGGLIQDAVGDLYGTTILGGNVDGCPDGGGCGTAFKLARATRGASANITLTSSPNPSQLDQPVTFSVVVSGSGAIPSGSVTFEKGKTALGTVTLTDGQASLTTTFTKMGKFSIVASYSGDKNYKATKSKPYEQVVEK
jgi:uncharacterized repeat protein (TIGR03803 family)